MSKTAIELGPGTTIPVIDFSGFTSCDEVATREATAGSIRQAFEDFGFLYLRNHGVPQSVIDELFSLGCAFFALPAETKTRAGGYAPPGYSGLDPTKPADVKSGSQPPTTLTCRPPTGQGGCLVSAKRRWSFTRQHRQSVAK
jgi:non-haem dioxygenase in morphine synthesis N-terminal